MREILRVFLCGAVAGLVLHVVKSALLALLAGDALAALNALADLPKLPGIYFLLVDAAMGVWVVWIYGFIAQRHGEGARSVLLAGAPCGS